MTQALKGRKLMLVGFTLFSMFFGAGNLIFPPDLGAKAGVNLWPAFLGLAISAVGLPVAGVIAVARADGLDKLAGRALAAPSGSFLPEGLQKCKSGGQNVSQRNGTAGLDPV